MGFPGYVTLVSANHASSNPGQIGLHWDIKGFKSHSDETSDETRLTFE